MKFYLDTSIFGGYFDKEFKSHTRALFEYINRENIEVIYSEILAKELKRAPEKIQLIVEKLENITYVELREEAIRLAGLYIKEGALTEKSINDAQHIAIATVEEAGVLVSWNFKHVVNFLKIRHYNSINLREGYRTISIHAPIEITSK
jgi:predicted nucleic acid-binding protein